ncbi:serine/threonine protein kinase [Candidatus Woesearchaeota archaeon]|nr:serine/threonine protein kinase [Candidatus Woesearchaeota archaeon]|tara:strand:+ start:14099 stop:14812 length:714 start_codon:yes stop_codon:yes gene_type:complete
MAKKFRERFKTQENVFDRFTIRNLFVLSSKDFFEEETLSPVSIGKEANVFSAQKGDERVIIKIYRLETADFKRMYEYIKPDPRYENLAKKRREIIFSWAQREYRNLMAARKALVKAPLPIAFMKNILVMSLVGDEQPAQKMKDNIPKQPKEFLDKIIDNMKKYYKAGFVHGDLSKFNILNHNEKPVLIDFSQASPLRAPHAKEMLKRDVHNVGEFFRKLDVEVNEEKLFEKITASKK